MPSCQGSKDSGWLVLKWQTSVDIYFLRQFVDVASWQALGILIHTMNTIISISQLVNGRSSGISSDFFDQHWNWNRMLLQRHCASSVILLVMQFLFSSLLRAYGGICWITRNFVLTAYLHCASEQKLSNVIHFELMCSALFPIASMEPVLKSLGYFCFEERSDLMIRDRQLCICFSVKVYTVQCVLANSAERVLRSIPGF